MEDLIESLIVLGYSHSAYIGELAKYKREGSIITLTHAQSGSLYHIEWFDTEIDSIIEVDTQGNRHYREDLWIKNETLGAHSFERKAGVLNESLLETVLSGDTAPTLILIGGDFLPYIEGLRNICQYHCTDFHREDSVSLDVSIPDIPHIDALKHFLMEHSTHANIRFYTKNAKSIQDFLEFHTLSGCEVIAVGKKGLESCIFPTLQPSSPPTYQPTILLADDILDVLFVRTRSKQSLAKNLDLLLHINP